MKKHIAAILVLLAGAASAHAVGQDTSGLYCGGGELTITTGSSFTAYCSGHLYVDSMSVIRADESISISSQGSLTLWGTLVAPRIQLTSNADLSVGGGLFSGSPDFMPEVNALSWVGSSSEVLRTFRDIVPNPIIDPVYGAVTVTQYYVEPMESTIPITHAEFVLNPPDAASPVPEPGLPAMLATGLAMLMWRARRAT